MFLSLIDVFNMHILLWHHMCGSGYIPVQLFYSESLLSIVLTTVVHINLSPFLAHGALAVAMAP